MRPLALLLFLVAPVSADDANDSAAMARRAADEGDATLGPRLLQCLSEAEDFAVRNAVLDALIRLRVDVPAEILVPLFAAHPDEVIILLTRDPVKNRDALLQLMDGKPDPSWVQWIAMADALAAARQPGVAARVFRVMKLQGQIWAKPDEKHGIGIVAGEEVFRVRATHEVRKGWPPLVRYTLTDAPRHGDVYLAGTRHRSYYRREAFRSGSVAYEELNPKSSTRDLCLDNLSEFLHVGWRRRGFHSSLTLSVVWEDEEQFLKAADDYRAEVEAKIKKLLDDLADAGAFTKEERAQVSHRIPWQVKDGSVFGELPLPKWPRDGS